MADAPALARLLDDPALANAMESVALPFTEADARARIETRTCGPDRFTLAIRRRGDGTPIGEIAAAARAGEEVPRLALFVAPTWQGEGFGAEALAAALEHAFRALGWGALEADAHHANLASLRVLAKTGFRRASGAARLPGHLNHSITRAAWEA